MDELLQRSFIEPTLGAGALGRGHAACYYHAVTVAAAAALAAPSRAATVAALYAAFPVALAPMEDVTDAGFRAVARSLGARLCFTEFIRAEQAIAGAALYRRKAALPDGDRPTAIQIYGADATLLMEAARIAAAARPAFVAVNCGCWLPRVARHGAGAAWLRGPAATVARAARVGLRHRPPASIWNESLRTASMELYSGLKCARMEPRNPTFCVWSEMFFGVG